MEIIGILMLFVLFSVYVYFMVEDIGWHRALAVLGFVSLILAYVSLAAYLISGQ